MPIDVNVERIPPGPEAELHAFYREKLPALKRFEALWRWRNCSRDISGGESATVARHEGQIAGAIGTVPVRLTMGGKTIHAAWQQDSLVLATMRGKGLGKKLISAAAEPYELILAKGTSSAMYGLRKAIGYNDVPLSDYLLTVLSPTLDFRSPIRTAAELALSLWQKVLPQPQGQGGLSIEPISTFDAAYDDLAAALAREARISPFKDAAYLNWRYFQCPVKTYTVLQAAGKKLRGAIVLGGANTAPADGWVVDMLCSSADNACACTLLAEARRFFARRRMKRIWTFATLPPARRWLMRFGFMPTKRSPRFTYLFRGATVAPDLLRGPAWNFWHGDGDIDLYL